MLCFLILIALLNDLSEKNKAIYYLVVFVVILFSLYLLATNNLTSFDFKVIGFVTPIGGPTYSGLGRIIFHF
jgi:uncharacterized membrane protein YgdD (TMEM256/DUF423 family)